MPAPPPLIEARGLVKRFGGFTAVDDVSIEVGDGEFELFDPATNKRKRRPFSYEGQESDVFRLGAGPDGRRLPDMARATSPGGTARY